MSLANPTGSADGKPIPRGSLAEARVGFRTSRATPTLTQVMALFLVVPVAVLLLCLYPIVIVSQGRPFFFGSVRAGRGGRPFVMWKIRTMEASPGPEAVLGAESRRLVTPIGAWLRRTRLDELPQVVNLLLGDIVFIGPRPPFPRHLSALSEGIDLLPCEPPGLTGLATVTLCGQEEGWLASQMTPDDVDRTYRAKCLPRKRRFDLFYHERRSAFLVVYILVLTFWRGPRALASMRSLRRRIGRTF